MYQEMNTRIIINYYFVKMGCKSIKDYKNSHTGTRKPTIKSARDPEIHENVCPFDSCPLQKLPNFLGTRNKLHVPWYQKH